MLIKTIISLSLIIFFLGGTKPSTEIIPGVGTDSISIGKTKITQVFARYSKRDDFNMTPVQGTDFSMDINRYYYHKPDLIFMTNVIQPSNSFEMNGEDTVNAVVADIVFGAKSGAHTQEGIIIGTDSLGQVRKIYGEPEKIQASGSDKTFIYTKKGISFTANTTKNIVYEIEVFRPRLFSSHY